MEANKQGVFSYLITKLAGAGFLTTVFFSYILINLDFDFYRFSNEISTVSLWLIFYAYAISCSLLIDLLVIKFPRIQVKGKILLYSIAGFGFFLFFGLNVFAIIAGTVGAICALIFYLGIYISRLNKVSKYFFAFIMPLLFIIIAQIDFTVKQNWTQTEGDGAFSAKFSNFNGEYQIPIQAKKGQSIIFSIDINNENGGGHGYHVRSEDDEFYGMEEVEEDIVKISVKETGIYKIIVTGDNLKGEINVNWEVK